VTDALHLAGRKLGNYRLHRILGRGNMGVVYLATDEALLRPTAVKVMTWAPEAHDPEAWFLAEARSVAKLNHPAVVQIYGAARHGAHCYLAMEYVEGVSADVMVARGGPCSAERATEIIVQVASALEAAHALGVVHRDVKPANLLIGADGAAKLGDFGMAISDRRAAPAGERAGTPQYLAPEIWRGERATPASDLYALGATYYFLLTGRPPFDAATVDALAAAHQRHELELPAVLTGPAAACLRIIRRCLAKAPSDRYASAAAVARDARSLMRPEDPSALTAGLGAADAGWQGKDFAFEPFAAVDPRAPPYRGAPFDELGAVIAARLTRPGSTLVVGGAAGSGRTVLARSILAGQAGGAYVDAAGARGGLIQPIAQALGIAGAPDLPGLLDAIAIAALARGVPLIVVDDVVAGTRAAADAAILARAARTTRHFNLLVVGQVGLAVKHGGPILASAALEVPALAARDVGAYVASWLAATRPAGAPPLIVTVDAALIAGHRAAGNLTALNALVRTMIAGGGPVLTSWDAWAARDDAGRDGSGLAAGIARPPEWPPLEVLALINQRRLEAGLAQRRLDSL
jgi:hypothetical protein